MNAEERMMTIMDKPLRRIAYLPPHDVDREGSVELLLGLASEAEGVLCCSCMADLMGAFMIWFNKYSYQHTSYQSFVWILSTPSRAVCCPTNHFFTSKKQWRKKKWSMSIVSNSMAGKMWHLISLTHEVVKERPFGLKRSHRHNIRRDGHNNMCPTLKNRSKY